MSRRVFKRVVLATVVTAQPCLFAEVPDELVESPLASAFGAPPTIGNPMLSPDGTRLLFMQQNPQGVSMLLSLNLADGEVDPLLQGTEGGYDILWCEFGSEIRVLCDLRKQGLPNRNITYQQFVAVNVDGTEFRQMAQATGCQGFDHTRDRGLIDRVPDDPRQIQFNCNASPRRLDTFTSNVFDAAGAGELGRVCFTDILFGFPSTSCHEPGPGDLGRGRTLYTDGHGLVNLFRGRQANHDRWFFRGSVEDPWEEFLRIDPLAFEQPFRPVGFGPSLDRVFNIAWDSESETWSLYRKDLTADDANERVFSHGAVDIELVDTMGRYERVVSAAFLDGRSRRAIVDARVAAVYEFLAGQLPEFDIEILDESWDQDRYLARVRAPNRTGELVLVDMAEETVDVIAPEYDHLADRDLAETRLVQFDASTGGSVVGHLTLPPGMDGPVPAVIMPRGRPSHEDIADPHYLVQFLAASGYAVFRVQNRVEAEYGRAWLPERAIIGWNQSADDVRDAVNVMIENGVTEPGRICGAGKDYGAHTAIMTAIKYPNLLSCIVSIAGVTDPRELPGGELINAAYPSEYGERIEQASPLRHTGELESPVLLFHGEGDTEFDITEQTLIFATSLERAGKDAVAIEYPNSTHAISREPDRVDMLTRMRGFLAENIGPALTEEEAASNVDQWRLVQ